MGGNETKRVMKKYWWGVDVVGGRISSTAAAPNAQRAKATGPPQVDGMVVFGCHGSFEEGGG
jgi:hypothetical protein